MQEIHYTKAMERTFLRLADGGLFLTCGGEKPNTMTIGWGNIGINWGLPTFIAMVRGSRFTFDGIVKTGEFTVSVPAKGAMKEQLAFAGKASGRDVDKFSGHGITAVPALQVAAPIIADCELHFECRVKYAQVMDGALLDPALLRRMYPEGDLHTMFYGQILTCYETK